MNRFSIKVRGILRRDSSILLCKALNHDFYFLPGGTLRLNENIQTCLLREFKEELSLEVMIKSFGGSIECSFSEKNKLYREINMLFHVYAGASNIEVKSNEAHLEFNFFDFETVISKQFPLLPCLAKSALIDKNPQFYTTYA